MNDNDLLIIGAAEVESVLEGSEKRVLRAVEQAYKAHARGESSLPHSSFLRFPDSDKDRIICLPAFLGDEYQLAGVKWIASMPDNLSRGIERASAVIVLNDRLTGRPKALLEGSIISKQRTAASAALASRVLASEAPDVISFVGCGPINVAVAQFLAETWPETRHFRAFDLDPARTTSFGESLRSLIPNATFSAASSLEEVLQDCPMVSFGTTAITPYLDHLDDCRAGATILHVSLRDLGVNAILENHNIVDDLSHVNRSATSICLASTQVGHTDFVQGSLGEVLLGKIELPEPSNRKVVFSPFGLGILDLAVADLVYGELAGSGGGTVVKSFLP